jgi:hypothetical protein
MVLRVTLTLVLNHELNERWSLISKMIAMISIQSSKYPVEIRVHHGIQGPALGPYRKFVASVCSVLNCR